MRAMLRATLCLLLAAATAAAADEVVLDNGDVIKGKVVETTDLHVVLDHPTLGKLDLPMGRVKSIALEGQEAPPRWSARLELGVTGSSGNADTFNFVGGFTSELKRPLDLTRFETRWFRSTTDGDTTQNRFYADLRKDWYFADHPRTSVFGQARYDRDQFQAWDQRATLAAGMAYKFIDTPRLFTAGRVGAAVTKEWGLEEPGADDDLRPEALLGVEAKWKVDDAKEVTAQVTHYPDLSDLSESRTVASAGLALRLDEKGKKSLRFGVEWEIDSHREPPFSKTDVRYFAMLIFEF